MNDPMIMQDLRVKLFDKEHLTTKSVAIEHSISRSLAESLLEALPYLDTSTEHSYDITRCVLDNHGDKIVARLQTDLIIVKPGDRQEKSEHPIHSISLHSTYGSTSLLAAHMKTLALMHDHQDIVLDPALNCDVIDPAESVEKLDVEFLRNKRVSGDRSVLDSKIGSSGAAIVKKSVIAAPVKKAITAAEFFGKNTKAQTSEPKEKIDISNNIVKKTSESQNSHRNPKPVAYPKNEAIISKKGNADDFVGDEDEDDDFLEQEQERKKRVAKAEAKADREQQIQQKSATKVEQDERPKPLANESDMEVDDGDNEAKVHGAIDAFAVKTKKPASDQNHDQTRRKRRKQVLEERTYVDDKGFFRTEMVTVWVEIDDTEDEHQSAVDKSNMKQAHQKPAQKPKDTKGMKQQGLMGFFGKK